jgi:hypothetical protein
MADRHFELPARPDLELFLAQEHGFHADADGWLHMLFATRWHNPVTQ